MWCYNLSYKPKRKCIQFKRYLLWTVRSAIFYWRSLEATLWFMQSIVVELEANENLVAERFSYKRINNSLCDKNFIPYLTKHDIKKNLGNNSKPMLKIYYFQRSIPFDVLSRDVLSVNILYLTQNNKSGKQLQLSHLVSYSLQWSIFLRRSLD